MRLKRNAYTILAVKSEGKGLLFCVNAIKMNGI